MEELQDKIKLLRDYALNINAIDDISELKKMFSELNDYKLSDEMISKIDESLVFMIEQLSSNNRSIFEVNDKKIEILRSIIQEDILNILDPVYYYYYLSIREHLCVGRHDIVSLLEKLYDEDISFMNELQKISFLVNIKSIENIVSENNELLDLVIEKIETANVGKPYPEFAPTKIKQLEERNKILEEEIANLNYIMMMNNMI